MTESGESNGWEDVGRSLLAYKLETTGAGLQTSISRISQKVHNNEEITHSDARDLEEQLREAEFLLEEIAQVADGFNRPTEQLPENHRQEGEVDGKC